MTQELSLEQQSAIPPQFAAYLPPALAEVNVPAYVIDRSGRVCWVNAAAGEIAGDCVGRQFTELVAMDPRQARRIFHQNLAGGKPRDRAFNVIGPDGEETTVEVSAVRLGDEHHAVGMFGLAVPATRRTRIARGNSPLTARQHEVLDLLADGASTSAIASHLYLSEQTVRNHIRQIMQRLDTNSRLAAVARARRDGLI